MLSKLMLVVSMVIGVGPADRPTRIDDAGNEYTYCEVQPFALFSRYAAISQEFLERIEREDLACVELAVYMATIDGIPDEGEIYRSLGPAARNHLDYLFWLFEKYEYPDMHIVTLLQSLPWETVDCIECRIEEVRKRLIALERVVGFEHYKSLMRQEYEEQLRLLEANQ